jgi:molybdate transport system substrate-binding protein
MADRDVTVFSATAMREVLTGLAGELEQAAGGRIAIAYATSGGNAKRLIGGEAADLIIIARPDIDGLIKGGHLVPGSDAEIARSQIGVGVRKGASRPDISTPEALKRALLDAKTVAYTDPKAGGASGAYFETVLREMGIAGMVEPKLAAGGPNGLVGTLVVHGEAAIGVQQIPELIAAGVDLLGPLPGSLQRATSYVAAIPVKAARAQSASALIALLTSPAAAAIVRAHGMDAGR